MNTRRTAVSISFLLALGCFVAGAQHKRNLLAGTLTGKDLGTLLVPRSQWHPYPTIDDREGWSKIPAQLRFSYVRRAEALLGTSWDPLPATVALEFVRTGNRSNYERLSFGRREKLAELVIAEVLENRGRFLDDIANGIWAICEESYWGVPAHLGLQRKGPGLPDVTEPTVDLFAAETGSLLSWTVYLLGSRLDKVSPLLTDRIIEEVEYRILRPNLQRDDFWWMGFSDRNVNNWNPWINSNWLAAALLLEREPSRRERAVRKAMTSLDVFLNSYPDDGGCDEGPGYWGRAGASLFDCLELLHSATSGAIDLYQAPLIKAIGQYIYKVYIKDEYFINFADASGKLSPEAGLIYRYGKRINDPVMSGFGAYLAQQQGAADPYKDIDDKSLGRLLPNLFIVDELHTARPAEPFLRDFWFPDLQVAGARSEADTSKGLYVAAKGGHNAESHNHNDVGNFIVYADGKPILIDVGVETYTAKTFSSHRYEIWTMQSAYHNLPTINGVMQKDGREFRARNVTHNADDSTAIFSLDIAGAYPVDAKVGSWIRTIHLLRGKSVELEEKYALKEFVQPFSLNLMTPLWVDTSNPGRILLADAPSGPGKEAAIAYDASQFNASAQEIKLTDERLKSVWGPRLERIVLLSTSSALTGQYKLTLTY